MAYQFTQTGAEIQDILDLAQLQIAAPYDSASSYTAGDYCTKDDGFYVCTASTSGTWDASKWSAVTVGDVLETANANISSLNATLTNKFTSGTWTPTVVNANTSQTCTGKWWKIGDVVFLHIHLWFSTTQTNQGAVYINENSLPAVAQGKSISGTGGTGSYTYTLATAANSNIWISVDTVGRTNATNAAYNGTSPQFAAFALTRG